MGAVLLLPAGRDGISRDDALVLSRERSGRCPDHRTGCGEKTDCPAHRKRRTSCLQVLLPAKDVGNNCAARMV